MRKGGGAPVAWIYTPNASAVLIPPLLKGKSEIILGPTDISSSEWYCSLRGENWTTNLFYCEIIPL